MEFGHKLLFRVIYSPNEDQQTYFPCDVQLSQIFRLLHLVFKCDRSMRSMIRSSMGPHEWNWVRGKITPWDFQSMKWISSYYESEVVMWIAKHSIVSTQYIEIEHLYTHTQRKRFFYFVLYVYIILLPRCQRKSLKTWKIYNRNSQNTPIINNKIKAKQNCSRCVWFLWRLLILMFFYKTEIPFANMGLFQSRRI